MVFISNNFVIAEAEKKSDDDKYADELREKLNIQNNQLYVRLYCFVNRGEKPEETLLTLQSEDQGQELFDFLVSYNISYVAYDNDVDNYVSSAIFLVNHHKYTLINCIQSAQEFKQIIAEKVKELSK